MSLKLQLHSQNYVDSVKLIESLAPIELLFSTKNGDISFIFPL